jgi:predicted HicB family RNase H-like nuclease
MESETLTIRIPKKLKAELFKAAAASDRSVTHYVVHALKLLLAKDAANG